MDIRELPLDRAEQIVRSLTLEQKIGQMVIASIEVTEMDSRTRAFLRDNRIGNVILFGKNCAGRTQLAALNRAIQDEVTAATGLQALISIDQEGGRVTRIRKGATVFPSAMSVGASGGPDNAFVTGYIMGTEMKALGIFHDLAPVLDCNLDDDPPAHSNRSYAIDPEAEVFGDTKLRLPPASLTGRQSRCKGHGTRQEGGIFQKGSPFHCHKPVFFSNIRFFP